MNAYHMFDLSTTYWMVRNVLDWDVVLGGDQWFADGAACQKQDRQGASCVPGCPRDHTRLNWSGQNAGITATPMHHDSFDVMKACEYADSFNSGRNHAKDIYQSHGYFVVYTWTGNTAAIKQCNGLWVASDGYYARIYD